MEVRNSYGTLFDPQSSGYFRYRPAYPEELFDYLTSLSIEKDLAWDVGTGSGQAALALAKRFEHVIATDSSETQLAHAPANEKISYRVAPAGSSDLETSSCDLLVVASAVHWFDRAVFFEEARRALKPGGIIAVWCYSLVVPPAIIRPEIEDFYAQIDPFWPAPIQLVKDHYRTLDFPFEEIISPEFAIKETWPISRLLGFYDSWSAVQQCKLESGVDSIAMLTSKVEKTSPLDTLIELNLPLYMRVGICKKAH